MNEKAPYSGSENLEIMKEAVNYNRFLKDMVAKYAMGRSDNRARILDFGAGIGTFSGSVPVPVDRISCVEPDQEARRMLSDTGYTVFESADQLPLLTYSYVFSLNVLEHIEDHEAVVAQLYDAIEPGGRIYFYLPAFNHLRTSMDDQVGHHRRYTRSQLIALVSQAGFTHEDSGYTDFLGYFATWAVKWMERFQRQPTGVVNKRLLVAYDRFAFPVSRALSVIFKRVVGKNVYIVARK
ncbi:MAG: class I SAM-dependent methyltransferase [Proteobacteria bacterium]|nr:class I SAM-dependent methyltransferase [Pseudomonadota bacterium]